MRNLGWTNVMLADDDNAILDESESAVLKIVSEGHSVGKLSIHE